MPDPFEVPLKTLRWAKAALDEVDDGAREWNKSKPVKVIAKQLILSGETSIRAVVSKPLPDIIERKVTEALVSTRHAFDQAVFAVFADLGIAIPDGVNIHFPWATTARDMERKLERMCVPIELWNIFREAEPYQAPDQPPTARQNVMRYLATLANSKHGIGIEAEVVAKRLNPLYVRMAGDVRLIGKWDSVHKYLEVARGRGAFTLDYNGGYTFAIRPRDPEFPANTPMGGSFLAFIQGAENITKTLRAECQKLKPAGGG